MPAETIPVGAERIAGHFDARRTGAGRWTAKCPAHDDSSPSLSIASGRDGRVLLRCWAGCSLDAILKASDLTIKNLFPQGPQLTAAQIKAATAERGRQEEAKQAQRETERRLADRYRKLDRLVDELGGKLARAPEGTDVDALSTVFHDALAKFRAAELEITNAQCRNNNARLQPGA
jgi:hypothetical protein